MSFRALSYGKQMGSEIKVYQSVLHFRQVLALMIPIMKLQLAFDVLFLSASQLLTAFTVELPQHQPCTFVYHHMLPMTSLNLACLTNLYCITMLFKVIYLDPRPSFAAMVRCCSSIGSFLAPVIEHFAGNIPSCCFYESLI
ncbi:hypothetical protein ACH5RR_034249 [Cinchona calisaya]|uniref:Uncharacterized protein n=1 Tax=Cinchona calisaya TaxID=153742 RepID=A0ABD2YFT5_9GENT